MISYSSWITDDTMYFQVYIFAADSLLYKLTFKLFYSRSTRRTSSSKLEKLHTTKSWMQTQTFQRMSLRRRRRETSIQKIPLFELMETSPLTSRSGTPIRNWKSFMLPWIDNPFQLATIQQHWVKKLKSFNILSM